MLQAIRARREDEGFTLIELMVVVLIIAILIAIAIPSFLGARTRAEERGAQANARTALVAAKTVLADTGNYGAIGNSSTGAALMEAEEPSLTWVSGAVDGVTAGNPDPTEVGFLTTATSFTAVAKSSGGTCFYIKDTTTAGTQYAEGAATSTGNCSPGDTVTYGAKW